MTDARFPERWLNLAALQRVSPTAYRLFGNALMWSVANGTDGHIPVWALGLIPSAEETDAKELAQVSLWLDHVSDGWVIAPYEDTQTTRSDLELLANGRRQDAARKRRVRHHKQGDHSLCVDDCPDVRGTCPGDSPEGQVRGTPIGQAKDRTGKEQLPVQGRNLRRTHTTKETPDGRSSGISCPPDSPPDIAGHAPVGREEAS
jgi:hypothetical protein